MFEQLVLPLAGASADPQARQAAMGTLGRADRALGRPAAAQGPRLDPTPERSIHLD
jgi:hypothetical protein